TSGVANIRVHDGPSGVNESKVGGSCPGRFHHVLCHTSCFYEKEKVEGRVVRENFGTFSEEKRGCRIGAQRTSRPGQFSPHFLARSILTGISPATLLHKEPRSRFLDGTTSPRAWRRAVR